MRAARRIRVSSTGVARHVFERGYDFGDGCRGDDLAIRARTQQRLERRQVIGDLRPVIRRGAERIRPVGDAVEDDVDRRAQQHDSVEAVIDRALIRHAAGDEEPARAVAVDERLDLVKVSGSLAVWVWAIQNEISRPRGPGVEHRGDACRRVEERPAGRPALARPTMHRNDRSLPRPRGGDAERRRAGNPERLGTVGAVLLTAAAGDRDGTIEEEEERSGSDGTRTRDLRRDRPAL
jgi:hypothetical protein